MLKNEIIEQQEEEEDKQFLIDLSISYLKSISISIVIKYEISKLIKENGGELSCFDMVNKHNVNANVDCLCRLLRSLSTIGIYHEQVENEGTFKNTNKSLLLLGDDWLNIVKFQLSMMTPFSFLEKSIETGENYGVKGQGFSSCWEFYENNLPNRTIYHNAMKGYTSVENKAILTDINFNNYNSILDIGGSSGVFLKTLINSKTNDTSNVREFINFDLPIIINNNVADNTDSRYKEAIGNMFESIPSAQCYTLKHIIHMFQDDKALTILNNIGKSIELDGNVYIFSYVIHPNKVCAPFFFDLQMMNMHAGKERTFKEWNSLIDKSVFQIDEIKQMTNTKMSFIKLSLKK